MRDYWKLVRPRILLLVLFSMAAAAWVSGEPAPSWPELAHALLGTGLVIAGAVALNQRLEVRSDAQMPRTAGRPLPTGRLTKRQVTVFGLVVSGSGFVYLVLTSHAQVVGLALASWLVYVLIYTPLKSRTVWQTPVGAVAGAMPVLIGASVAQQATSPMAWSLFGIVCLWQFPHAMAIAWLYREEFASAEVKLAAVVDPTGRTAGALAVLGAAGLVPLSLIPPLASWADWRYGAVAALLGAVYLGAAIGFLRRRNDGTARWLLRASLAYLPILLAALLCTA
jgi:protoheme IX farnesyltransferase